MIRKLSVIYRTAAGKEPYSDYVDSLRDREGAAKIRVRVTRAEMGNLGDHRNLGHGVVELRVHYGPGHRIYAGLHGFELIVLLCAGAKAGQREDIRRAFEFWADYKNNL